MNERELDEMLHAIHLERMAYPDSDAVIRHALSAPIEQTPQRRFVLTSLPSRRFQTMFSASRFVVAGVIVALFGGFLLSGVLTHPSKESLPAVGASASTPSTTMATPTASPTTDMDLRTDLVPGSELVTREVEPGVFQVLHDGVRPLSYPYSGPSDNYSIVTNPDVSLSVYGSRVFYRVGDEATGRLPEDFEAIRADFATGTDERGWLGTPSGLYWQRGRQWASDPEFGTRNIRAIEVGPEDEHWIMWCPEQMAPDRCAKEPRISLRASGRNERIRIPQEYQLSSDGFSVGPFMAVDGAGGLWVSDGSVGLLHYDGSEWEVMDPVGKAPYGQLSHVDVGADGTLWAYLIGPEDSGQAYLARRVGETWTVFDRADGVPPMSDLLMGALPGILTVGGDGSVWLVPSAGAGVWHFDGSTWRTFLRGVGVESLAITSDGSAWVHTSGDANVPSASFARDVHTYVITHEAVASAG